MDEQPAHDVPLRISFRGMGRSDAVADRITHEVHKLARYCERIVDCHVSVDATPHPGRGFAFRVHVHLTIPGAELAASHDADPHHAHDNVFVAIRDAMAALGRQVRERTKRARSSRHRVSA